MPVSRPSQVGKATPSFPWMSEEYVEEREEVDRKLAQLAEAREKAAAARARKREEKRQRFWEWRKQHLKLSSRQDTLLRAVDGKALLPQVAIEAVYGFEWSHLGKRQRSKYLGRLRTLQHALNRKLLAKGRPYLVSIRKGKIRLVAAKDWKSRVETRRSQKRKSKGRSRSAVKRCAEWLRWFLTEQKSLRVNGWLSVSVLTQAARRQGFRPSTIKSARKRLGLLCKRTGYGARGCWLVCLPTRKRAKT
jgi:hypothetical protein